MTKRESKHIAHDIAQQMLRYGEGCTRDELLLHFTAEELDTHGEAGRALALANYRSIRPLAA